MSKKENVLPGLRVFSDENSNLNTKETTSAKNIVKGVIVTTQQQPAHVLKTAANVNHAKKTFENNEKSSKSGEKKSATTRNEIKKSFAESNKSPVISAPITPIRRTTARRSPTLVQTTEHLRRSPSPPDEKPYLDSIYKKESIHIHHKESKPLSVPVNHDQADQDIIIAKLKAEIEKLQQTKKQKNQELAKIKERTSVLKKEIAQFDIKIRTAQPIQSSIDTLYESIAEQKGYLAELDLMIYGVNEKGLEHLNEMEEKDKKINDALNELSMLNYDIAELKEILHK